jgi:hypothetical protein
MELKYSLAITVALIISIHTIKAQQKGSIKSITSAEDLIASFADIHYSKTETLPFKNIVVVDYRYDSSKIGYVWIGKKNSTYGKIRLESNWSSLLNNYFE